MSHPPSHPPSHLTPRQITRALDRILHKVEKPARYTGGELNSVVKDWMDPAIQVKVALTFPDIYELGGSNLGLMVLYDLINRRSDLLAERVYCPWPDFEAYLRRDQIPLYGLETRHPLAEFDLIGFSLPYEQLYTNVLTMLDLSGLPLRAADRGDRDPLVIAGGSGCYNPEPMSAFFDAMIVGEGEEVLFEVIAAVKANQQSPNRQALLATLATLPGVYVPSFYTVQYAADGSVAAVTPTHPAAPAEVLKRVVTVLPPPAEQTATPYAKWERGFGKDPAFFPIAVWLQDPKRAKEFAACGINLYIGLWKGPTEQQLADLKAAGMRVICAQNEVGLAHKDDPTIAAWMHGDEPDNAQAFKGYWQEDKEKIKEGWPDLYARLNLAKNDYRGYGPSIPPKWIVRDYEELRAKDPSRPIILNLGQGVAWEKFIGRGERTGKLEDYPEYIKGCDIVSFDIYPAVAAPGVKGNLWYVARGVKRLREWGQDQRPVWNCIECTRIGNPNVKPTPAQVRAEVWMSLIHGSRGLIYFVHQFKPNFIEAALLVDPDMVAGVTATNQQIHALAPVLNSPTIADGVAVETQPKETPVHAIVKRHGGATYVFAVAMHDQETTATLRVKDLPAGAKLEVLGENREVAAANGAFNDHFTGYAVHLYRTR